MANIPKNSQNKWDIIGVIAVIFLDELFPNIAGTKKHHRVIEIDDFDCIEEMPK